MEGSQTTTIIAKLLMAIIEKLFKLIDRIRRDYLEYCYKKQQLGHKKKSVSRSDKRQLQIAKNFKKSLVKREKILSEKVKESQYNLDLYKLEMQRKLEDHNIGIKKAQRAYDIAKENYDINIKNKNYPQSQLEQDKNNLSKLQENINIEIEQKRNFEIDVNKNLLLKDKLHKELLSKYNQLLDDIKVCDRAIDGFDSKFDKHITESVRNNFNEAIERNTNDIAKDIDTLNDNKFEINKNDDFMKEYLEKQRRKSLAKEKQKDRCQIMER